MLGKIQVASVEVQVWASNGLGEDKLLALCGKLEDVFDEVQWAGILQQKLEEAGINKGLTVVVRM